MLKAVAAMLAIAAFTPLVTPPTQPIDVDHFVTPIKQQKKWHCWAASTAMINNWRRAKTGQPALTAQKTAEDAGPTFAQLYAQGDTKGITPEKEAELYQKINFGYIRQQNPTISGWADMLRTKGPLGVTLDVDPTDKWAIHEIVLTTMKGDGTPNGTKVTYTDPGDGLPHTMTFQQFVTMYEQAAGYAIQIAHAR